MGDIKLDLLKEPFIYKDLEWRATRSGLTNNNPWVRVVAYVDNRAIMDRLDEVCGQANWRNEYASGPVGGVICGLSIKVDGEWITKWDGGDNTNVEAVKGGLSVAMKRAAVQWGIGRYLYDIPEQWAAIDATGAHTTLIKDKQTGKQIYVKWNPPNNMPDKAKPKGVPFKPKQDVTPENKEKTEEYYKDNIIEFGEIMGCTELEVLQWAEDEKKNNRLSNAGLISKMQTLVDSGFTWDSRMSKFIKLQGV